MSSLGTTPTMFNDFCANNLLKAAFELDRTILPGRSHSTISYGKIGSQGKTRLVVLKTIRQIGDTTRVKVEQRIYHEVKLLVALNNSSALHPNINKFHGLHFVDSTLIKEAVAGLPSIVTDFVQHDSIEYTEGKDFGQKLSVVQQVANGLAYLHSLDLVHGNPKPDNFRVTENGVVKIIDFGLGRYQADECTATILPCYRFIAPELVHPESDSVTMSVTKATDVYAFSMSALQVLDGRGHKNSLPFNRCAVPFAVRLAIVTQQWPQAQDYPGVISEAWSVISACWTSEASARPTINGLLTNLNGIQVTN